MNFDNDYFEFRMENDPLRLTEFINDSIFVKKYVNKGVVCDVGCSTGEFSRKLDFFNEIFGMEINEFAKEKASDVVCFDKDIYNENDFFDAVIFRGTIQHVDKPFEMLEKAFQALKPGGCLFLLATPNSDSILYRLKSDLPMIDWPRVLLVPGRKMMINALTNLGFELVNVEFPYFRSAYKNILSDHLFFLLNCITPGFFWKHAFWGSVMNICVRKPL